VSDVRRDGSITPPLVLEAAYLAASAPVDLPVILPRFVCLVIGPCFHLAFMVSFRPLVWND